MERMFAVAIRDRNYLFLWIRLRRAAGNDIYYVLPTGREHDPKWVKWNPHGSWHKDGRVHHKSFNSRWRGACDLHTGEREGGVEALPGADALAVRTGFSCAFMQPWIDC